MISWLLAIKELRNRASHNARTWNSNYRLPSGFVDNKNALVTDSYLTIPPVKKNKIYLILATIKLITDNLIKQRNQFSTELQELLKSITIIAISYQVWDFQQIGLQILCGIRKIK